MLDFLIFFIFTLISFFLPDSMVAIKSAVVLTAFIGLIRFFLYVKKVSFAVNLEADEAATKNYKNYPYFVGKYIEITPIRTTSLVDAPMMVRYLDIKTQEEVFRLTRNVAFINVSNRHTHVKVYYDGSYIVNVFPSDE